jgi:CHRD domain
VRMRILAAAVVAAASAIVPATVMAGRTASTAAGTTLTVKLTGAAETPKGPSTGKGTAAITINGAKVCWKFSGLTGIDKPTAAHIHKGAPGTSGPVVVPFGAAFKAAGCTTTTATIAKAILAAPSSYYVNVHTAKFPGGAVRAQLATFTVKLTGAAETPPGATAGHGTAAISISGTSVCWAFIGLAGIDKPTASHIHKGAPGTSGPVLVPLGAAFQASGCTTTTTAIAKAILAKPAAYYVNVHTAKFPGGAVRGQLGKSSSSSSSSSSSNGGYGNGGYG